MPFLARFSPFRAYRDLRQFFATRQSYHYRFMALSAAIVVALFFGFVHDSKEKREYKRNIIYVEQWPLSRTDAEIKAQQAIDQVAKEKRLAEEDRLRKERQAQFKKVDDQLKALGI
ncbi:MAG: hypothetical protein K2P68_12460 [Sphingomonas sp.]|nr:hypothetical protein [Sphingomonas sp.]